jgi:SAM-dependent methyltransferase
MLEYYPEDYLAYAPSQAPGIFARWSLTYGVNKQVKEVLKRTSGPGKVLDVGCGAGGFLSGMFKQGWQTHGMEINPRIASKVHRNLRLDIVLADSLDQAYASSTFDLITFWDVLEHLSDPRRALEEASRIGRSSGMLIISLPNPDSLEARWFGHSWAGWDIPRHLWLFPRPVVTRMLEEEGWKVLEIRTFRGRHWLLLQSLSIWLQDRNLHPLVYKILMAIFRSWIVKSLLLPYFVVVERMGKGSIMVFYAERK